MICWGPNQGEWVTGLNHAAASDPDPTVRTDELDAVLLTLTVQDRAKRRCGSRALAVVDHTVGIDVLQFVLAGSCVAPGTDN